jgi:opacity protein-like surface antigen
MDVMRGVKNFMRRFIVAASVALFVTAFNTALADDLSASSNIKSTLKPIISMSIGMSNTHFAQAQTISDDSSPAIINTYSPNHTTNNNGLYSLFAGAERNLNTRMNIQFGLAYYFIPSSNINGTLAQSIGDSTNSANVYNYQYAISSQQLLAEGKLLFKWRKHILPYISLGIGGAINHAGNYSATPESDTAGPPPLFSDHTQTNFSYSLGFGVDMILMPQVRLGIGYRYSNLGTVNLSSQDNSGQLQNKNYVSNALLTTLTYLF